MSFSNGDERKVWWIDTVRQSADGFIQPLVDSIFILVAISFFSVDDFWKGLITASKYTGFLFSVPLSSFLQRIGVQRSRILFFLTLISALTLATGTFVGNGVAYAISVSLCAAIFHLRQPFFTDLYSEYYHKEQRAQRISLGLRMYLLMSFFAGLAYGSILEINYEWWRIINLGAIAILVGCSIMLLQIPDGFVLPRTETWLKTMLIPFSNRSFLHVQVAWMFVGFANLLSFPLKVVYLAEADRGLELNPSVVTLILVVIPVMFQLFFNRIWARLYHKLTFPAMRIAINSFLGVSIPLFFLTESLWLIIISVILSAIGLSGSPYIWQLWVTRIARKEEVRTYQSAHAFLAGVRGLSAPFVGFVILRKLSFQNIGFLAGTLILISCLIVIPLFHRDRVF